jgi:hypothetical protein
MVKMKSSAHKNLGGKGERGKRRKGKKAKKLPEISPLFRLMPGQDEP